MELNENAQIDTSQVEDRRGSGGGGGLGGLPMAIGGGRGGVVGLIVTVVLLLVGGGFGVNALTGDDGGGGGDNTAIEEKCRGGNALAQRDCRNTLFVNSIQVYWQRALPERFGEPYQQARTVFFDQGVNTACGAADSGVGPFYCPSDRKIYIDLTFYDELARRFGAEGEFAQPYVLAHEYGHHVQNLLGTMAQVRRAEQRDPGNANRYSVMLELQADCYGGSWARNATQTTDAAGQPLFKSITREDIAQAVEAAGAIGDDAIQKKMGGGVDESKFTHGTAAQRQQWFTRGFDTGDPTGCDTFGNAL